VDTYRHFFYNNRWQILETRESSTENTDPEGLDPLYQYVWSMRYIDAPDCIDGGDQRLYYLTDANMNVTCLVDTGGDAVERYLYDPYGAVTFLDGSWSSRSASAYDNSILFCGYYRDKETGLYHVRHRVYHAQLGRWLHRDPIGYPDGANLYAYVQSHPTNGLDPSGLRDCFQEMLDCEEGCNDVCIACNRACMDRDPPWPFSRGSWGHRNYCEHLVCQPAFMACSALCAAAFAECQAEEAAKDVCEVAAAAATVADAAQWLADHPGAVVGAVVVVAGVTFVVATGGAGLVLVPAAAAVAAAIIVPATTQTEGGGGA